MTMPLGSMSGEADSTAPGPQPGDIPRLPASWWPVGQSNAAVASLLESVLGEAACHDVLRRVRQPVLPTAAGGRVHRAELAQALNMLLFVDLLRRVPSGQCYADWVSVGGGTQCLDHGALRTVAWPLLGQLPPGEYAVTRILQPLGYALAGVYPLGRLRMTGRSYAQLDAPEGISQFFVSELHPERFSPEFQAAVTRVFGHSRDPLNAQTIKTLAVLQAEGSLPASLAQSVLPSLLKVFACQHEAPAWSDYQALLQESPEAAWIATEGNAFNHATDRVADVQAWADQLRAQGFPIKPAVEVSGHGRVLQTAFRADAVKRRFQGSQGQVVHAEVPGSFYEFIERRPLPAPDGAAPVLDLSFDAGNATAIFKMTQAS